MELATTTGDFSAIAENQLKAIEYIAESGFHYIDYTFGPDYRLRNGIFSSDMDGYIKSLKEKCDELGVNLIQSHSPMGTPLDDKDGSFLNDTLKCIEACGKLGIRNIVIHSGYIRGLTKKQALEKNKEFYEKLLPAAEKYEVTILTENFNKMCFEDLYWIDNATDLLELVEYVNHPLFHVVWDTGHGNMQKTTQEEALKLLGNHVKALHVHDNNGLADQHLCPFFGTMDTASLMKGLKDIGYDGYFTFEADNFFCMPSIKKAGFEIDLELKLKAEKLLYNIGWNILKDY